MTSFDSARAGAHPAVRRWLILGTLMAVVAAVVYLAIGLGLMPEDFESPPRPVMLAAGVIYLAGSAALHAVRRRLLVVGALANAVVLALFLLSAVRGEATVDAVSLGGKAAQVVLSVVLVRAWQLGASAPRAVQGSVPGGESES